MLFVDFTISAQLETLRRLTRCPSQKVIKAREGKYQFDKVQINSSEGNFFSFRFQAFAVKHDSILCTRILLKHILSGKIYM
jgi:hypothetical protein